MNDAAIADVDAFIARLRGIPEALDEALPRMAATVEDYLAECAAKGIDPTDGKPWPRTDLGRQAKLTGTKRAVTVQGSRIVATVAGHDAMHTRGTARGQKVRRLIPSGGVPVELAKRLERVVEDVISKEGTA